MTRIESANVKGLTEAQRRLVEANVDLIHHHAASFAIRSIPYEDRWQDGALGLIEAARSWDASKGVSFRSYAWARVRGAMLDAERGGEGVLVRVPRPAWERMSDEERYRSQPNLRFRALRKVHDPRGQSSPDRDFTPASHVEEPELDLEAVSLAVERIGGTAAAVLRLYYWDGLTMAETGRRLGLSESRVSQIHTREIERLKEHSLIRLAVAV